MVFSFFKKPSEKKMPERPAAKPRPKPAAAVLPPTSALPASARPGAEPEPREPLPELEFTVSDLSFTAEPKPAATPAERHPLPSGPLRSAPVDDDFSIDDFESNFTESSVMGIDVDLDVDPMQACVEQVVVMYANGQDAAARSLLETFVRSYRGIDGKRFWLLMFDLLQNAGDQEAFEKLGLEYAQACETSPPTWRSGPVPVRQHNGGSGPRKIFLQGVVTQDGLLPIEELGRAIAAGDEVHIDCSKLIGCDDAVAGQLAQLLSQARKARLSVVPNGIEPFLAKLDARLVAGEARQDGAWRLLLELLQRLGSQERFEERAVDFAITFEVSPPSWEAPAPVKPVAAVPSTPGDGAYYLQGELKNCRFEELQPVLENSDQPVIDFAGVRRLDFVSAGQLVNRIAPYKAAGKDVIIRSPNHLVAELMAVVGLNKQARILVPKS